MNVVVHDVDEVAPVEQETDDDEAGIRHVRRVVRASLRIEPVGLHVDAFVEPLVSALQQFSLSVQIVELHQSGRESTLR